ncbi:hypothetical protein AOQ84DRAFT_184960 [Glonium stellatum]|uniref:Uncharacterized protein n=1 Tax=Glonium stellatum TaxID=574774 RepID=A0A8E2K0B3_9PEZI|nr:hypothetical protein AOQ84DRAFT_184960 [Glonium stellatum]
MRRGVSGTREQSWCKQAAKACGGSQAETRQAGFRGAGRLRARQQRQAARSCRASTALALGPAASLSGGASNEMACRVSDQARVGDQVGRGGECLGGQWRRAVAGGGRRWQAVEGRGAVGTYIGTWHAG